MGSMLHLRALGITRMLTLAGMSDFTPQVQNHPRLPIGPFSKTNRHAKPSSPLLYSCETVLCKHFPTHASKRLSFQPLLPGQLTSVPAQTIQSTCA